MAQQSERVVYSLNRWAIEIEISIRVIIDNDSTLCQSGSCYKFTVWIGCRNTLMLIVTVSKLGSWKQ